MSSSAEEILAQWGEAHGKVVLAYLRGRLLSAGQLGVEPEDLLQEVWLRAIACLAPHGELVAAAIEQPRAWLMRIAGNIFLEAVRGSLRRQRLRQPDDDDSSMEPAADITSITKRVVRDETVQRLRTLIGGLDAADRTVLIQHRCEGRPLHEVARGLGISEAAAAKRSQRLLAALREVCTAATW